MRIVSLLSSATEILFGVGAGPHVVAISHECDYPPEAISLARATRSVVDSSRPSREIDAQVKHLFESGQALYEIDRELIRQLKPDLIVTQAQCDVCAVRYQDVVDFVATEPGMARTKVLALNPQHICDILDDVRRVGQAVGRAEAADRYKSELSDRLERIRIAGASAGKRPRVAVIEWTEPLMAAGNWTPELVETAGGQMLLATAGQHSGYITWPELVEARPDVMIVAPCGFNLERSTAEAGRLVSLPGYRELPAVAQGRAFVVDGNAYLNRSGPRIIDSLEILAHLVRPEVFDPPTGDLAQGRAWVRLNL